MEPRASAIPGGRPAASGERALQTGGMCGNHPGGCDGLDKRGRSAAPPADIFRGSRRPGLDTRGVDAVTWY